MGGIGLMRHMAHAVIESDVVCDTSRAIVFN